MTYQPKGVKPILSNTVIDTDNVTETTCPFTLGGAQTIGARNAQEDAFLVAEPNVDSYTGKGLLAVVADGVGGLGNGQIASGAAVRSMRDAYARLDPAEPEERNLLKLLASAQREVLERNKSGVRCASTLTCVLVKDMQLSFLAVGDSHIYLCRAGGLLQLNREHVVSRSMDESEALGKVTSANIAKRKAVTSYLGKEDLTQIDRNITPIRLQAGDRVLLMSDGVFGTLTDDEIISCIHGTAQETANKLVQAVEAARLPHQDNATCVVISCNTNDKVRGN